MKRVLILDNDPAFLELATEYLSVTDPSLSLEVFEDGPSALDRIEVAPPDVFVAGLRSDPRASLEILIGARRWKRRLPVIGLVPQLSEEIRRDLTRLPGVEILGKPVSLVSLEQAIKRALREELEFSGAMSLPLLSELLPAYVHSGATGLLRIHDQEREGVIAIVSGSLKHAETGKLSGEEALFDLLSWERGRVEVKHGETHASETIGAPLDDLLMRARRWKEAQLRQGGTDPYGTRPFGPVENHEIAPRPAEEIEPENPVRLTVAGLNLPEAWLVETARQLGDLPLQLVSWRNVDDAVGGTEALVAVLPRGTRIIPAEVVEIMARMGNAASLVLLAEEALAQPLVNLQNGRVTLVGPPFSSARLVESLRILFAEQLAVPGACQRLAPRFYAASLGQCRLLLPRSGGGEAAVAIFPFDSVGVADVGRDRLAESFVTGELGEGEFASSFSGRALVALTPGAGEWVFFWPRQEAPLRMFSAQRMPRYFDLAGSMNKSTSAFLRLPAHSGDRVVALSRALPEFPLGEHLARGAPAALQALANQVQGVSAAVMEIR